MHLFFLKFTVVSSSFLIRPYQRHTMKNKGRVNTCSIVPANNVFVRHGDWVRREGEGESNEEEGVEGGRIVTQNETWVMVTVTQMDGSGKQHPCKQEATGSRQKGDSSHYLNNKVKQDSPISECCNSPPFVALWYICCCLMWHYPQSEIIWSL